MSPAQQQQQQSRSAGASEHEATIQWLKDNYQECGLTPVDSSSIPGVPRASIYERYQQQYSQQQTATQSPVNSATFGKLVRSVFPNIKTRRLGHRGQSKYYYCGIKEIIDAPTPTPPPPTLAPILAAQRPTESYDDQMNIDTDHEQIAEPSPQQLQPSNNGTSITTDFTMPTSLQLIPSAEDLAQRYRLHCNQILHLIDTHQNIREPIITFYETMVPQDIIELLRSDGTDLIESICCWDCTFYDAIISVYYPTIDAEVNISVIPQRLSELCSSLISIIPEALQNYPLELVENKLAVTRIFIIKLERIMHLNFLAQSSNQILRESSGYMLDMWKRIDLSQISDRTEWVTGNNHAVVVGQQFDHVTQLLTKSAEYSDNIDETRWPAVRRWIDWMNSVMNLHLTHGQSYKHIKELAVVWSTYTSFARREMELRSCNSPADSAIIECFEKLWIFTNDYIVYLVEQETAKRNAESLFVSEDDGYSNNDYSYHHSQRPSLLPRSSTIDDNNSTSYNDESGPSQDYMSTTATTPTTAQSQNMASSS